ncbi:acyltransferase family protein [Novosphingobium colocasiae]
MRLHRLDGLRGLAACGVAFLYHPQSLFAPRRDGRLATAVRLVSRLGLDDGGPVLPHFGLYLRARLPGGGRAGKKGHLREFAVARLARLYPLHLLTLCLCALLFAADPANTPLAFVANLAMLQGFYPPEAQAFNGPSWSISVECVCYLLFAMAAVGGLRRVRLVAGLAIAGALVHFILQGRAGGPWTSDDLSRGLLGFFSWGRRCGWRGAAGAHTRAGTGGADDRRPDDRHGTAQFAAAAVPDRLACRAAAGAALALCGIGTDALAGGDRSYAIYPAAHAGPEADRDERGQGFRRTRNGGAMDGGLRGAGAGAGRSELPAGRSPSAPRHPSGLGGAAGPCGSRRLRFARGNSALSFLRVFG